MRKLVYIIPLLVLTNCITSSINSTSKKIIKDYQSSINNNDYNLIKPHLDNSLMVDKMDYNSTWIMFYSYVNFGQNEKIRNIEIDKIEPKSDSIKILHLIQNFDNGQKQTMEMNLLKKNNLWKISRISSFQPNNFTLTTRASFVNEDVFGNDRVNNIVNLKILDKSKADSLVDNYRIYYDAKDLKQNADFTLNRLKNFDEFLLNRFKFNTIHREDILLSNINSRNTITIGKGLDIPWVISLTNNTSENNKKINKLIANTYSHEIVEGALLNEYNLKDIKFRWFRDGLSEYIAYKYSSIIDLETAETYFLKNRQSDYLKNKQNGNLLDWRGSSANPSIDKGTLYGSKYIYENDNGQYGRAFMFFKNSFENKEEILSNILSSIYNKRQNISVEELLEIMDKEMNEDVIKKLSEY